CLLCCQDQLHISDGVSSVHTDHFDFPYGTADIMSTIKTCDCLNISVVLFCGLLNQNKEFVEVKNQKVKSDSFPYNFTVCLSTMFDFTNVLQLVQSLEMLQLLGVNRVVVYKTSCSPETQRILDYYTHKGLVEVIPWSLSKFINVSRGWLPSHGPGDIHYLGQIPALNDCLYRYMYQSKYMALHDIDELILPQSCIMVQYKYFIYCWLELLPQLEKKYGADQCYMFENNVFPITVTLPPPTSQTLPLQNHHWQNVSGVNILAHLYHEPIIPETHYSNFKIIVNPRAVYRATVHGLLKSVKGCAWVDRNIARMYHTRDPRQPKLTPNQLIYDGRLLSYSTHLIPAVNTVLRENGLLPEDSIQ
uniref:Glycosyltransferase family 92 protein n=1 Tax=Lates calcarifer TaxID=8187 RepID=A0A4W6D3N5_LATCA